eukprot:1159522-Pelagomonas_calceolata.AAC.8
MAMLPCSLGRQAMHALVCQVWRSVENSEGHTGTSHACLPMHLQAAGGGPLSAVPGGLIGSSAAAGAGSGSNCASPM